MDGSERRASLRGSDCGGGGGGVCGVGGKWRGAWHVPPPLHTHARVYIPLAAQRT